MFSEGKKTKGSTTNTHEQNKIAQGTKLVGDIEAEGCFRIEGTLVGNLKTPSKIVVSKTGTIEGDVVCGDADIEGSFTGTLTVKNNLNLKATCTIQGEVTTGKLSVEPGANLNGSCTMKGAVKTLKDESKGSRQKEKSA